jgi:putative nucleotidyltransferase with HDIG domain
MGIEGPFTPEELTDRLDEKDSIPKGHSVRVARWSAATAKELGLAGDEVRKIEQAGMLHDVGKIGLSEDVVGKLGRLSDKEIAIMRLHATIGLKILERIEGLEDIFPLIKHHHERLDGTGYPDGLQGDDIPLGSRIIAVTEAYDNMTLDLPWRGAMSQEEALAELRRCSGTQFDARVVGAFEVVLRGRAAEQPLRRAA